MTVLMFCFYHFELKFFPTILLLGTSKLNVSVVKEFFVQVGTLDWSVIVPSI